MSNLNGHKPFWQLPDLCIIHDDVLHTGTIRDSSIDLIVTSPPYNVDIPYNSHEDGAEYEVYLRWSESWLHRCFDWLKPDGRMCLNIPLDKNKGGQQAVGADITSICRKIGYGYHSTIIWNEGNISRRTAWGSWRSASAPYVIAPVELIVVLYKSSWKKLNKGVSDISRDEFMDWTSGVWNFSGEKKSKIGHPAPFPIELPSRCIKLFSYVDDIILDPFLGSGSTLVAAQKTGRKGIGIERIGIPIPPTQYKKTSASCPITREAIFRLIFHTIFIASFSLSQITAPSDTSRIISYPPYPHGPTNPRCHMLNPTLALNPPRMT